jgi:hypothetical protein
MSIKAPALGLAAATITAIAFGIWGLLFAIVPGPASAFVGWVLHIDVSEMTRPVSAWNLLGGIVLFGGYVGLFVGVTAALYNRMTAAKAA